MSTNVQVGQKIGIMDVATVLARVAVGAILIWYSFPKIANPIDFMKDIHEYHLFPDEPALLINLTAAVLPWFELIAGLALIAGVFLRGASSAVALMLITFTLAIFVRAKGVQAAEAIPFCDIEFDCGCGAGVVVICSKLLKNSALILLSLIVVFSTSRRFCLATGREYPPTRPSEGAESS